MLSVVLNLCVAEDVGRLIFIVLYLSTADDSNVPCKTSQVICHKEESAEL